MNIVIFRSLEFCLKIWCEKMDMKMETLTLKNKTLKCYKSFRS